MHPLQNGSQATVRPDKKPLSGTPGWFTESGDNNVPSYPGADWFNHVIAEFQNSLLEAGVVFDENSDENLAKAFRKYNDGIVKTSVSDLLLGNFNKKGQVVQIPERANAFFTIDDTGIADGGSILDAGNGYVAKLNIEPDTPVEAWGLYANGTDMTSKLALVEKDKCVLIFSDENNEYVFNSKVETTREHLIHITNSGVNLRVNGADGMFKVNHAPFQIHGSGNKIFHNSRIVEFGNDPGKLFKDIHLWDFVCIRDDVLIDKSPFYFPNTPTTDLNVKNVQAFDADTPANRCVSSGFIQLEFGASNETKRIKIENLYSFGYESGFATYGTGYAFGLTARNVEAQSPTGSGFRNYHCYYSDLDDVKLINNGKPGYAWLGFGVRSKLSAYNAQVGGWLIEQATCDVNVTGHGCQSVAPTGKSPLTVISWGCDACTVTVNSRSNDYALEINPQNNVAATSNLDNITIHLSSTNDLYGAARIDNNNNANHSIRQIDIYPNIVGNVSVAAIQGVNLESGFTMRLHGGRIEGYSKPWDMRIPSGVGSLNCSADSTTIFSTTSDGPRNDCNAGMNQLFNCRLDDSSKYTTWAALGSFNRFDDCFDLATKTVVSG